jgi:folate-binding protein YgfZ
MPELPSLTPEAWRAALEDAVVADAAEFGVLEVSGPDAAGFLQGQVSSDVKALGPGSAQRSTYNSPKGRMLATLVLGRPAGAAPDRHVALLAADLAEPVRKRLAMFVLRSKVAIADATPSLARIGIGGPRAADAVAAALGCAVAAGGMVALGETTVVHLPEGRLVVLTPAATAAGIRERLAAHATTVPAGVWAWLGVRAAVPIVTAATQDLFVAQTANQDALAALDFRKGCYTGQEIIARTQYLGRLKERLHVLASPVDPPPPGTRLYAPVFGDQACGTVVNGAPRPEGGSLLLAVMRSDAASGPIAIGTVDGPAATIERLPYALPEPAAPPGRVKL